MNTPTRDELLRLAKEAGLPISSENYDIPTGYERFSILLLSTHQAQPDVAEMVNKFLGWKLPKDFCPDAGISFKPSKSYEGDEYGNSWWPTGTNLLSADQARQMFLHCLPAHQAPAQSVAAPADGPMVDIGPPATSRDRWMYEQGRLAERDPRSHVTAQQAPAVNDKVRYCYECGRIGEVDSKARDCCPDGSHAVYVPRELAKQSQTGFFALLSKPASAPAVSKQTKEPK